jgi:hypothetical protein
MRGHFGAMFCSSTHSDGGYKTAPATNSIFIEQLLYPLINVKEVLPSLVDLVGKVKAFKGFDALPYVLDRIASDVVVPNEIRRPIPLT